MSENKKNMLCKCIVIISKSLNTIVKIKATLEFSKVALEILNTFIN